MLFLHFTLFGSFGIHAKDTDFIFGIPQTYTWTDTQTWTHTCTEKLTHSYRYTRDICMFVYKQTHTTHTPNVHVGNIRKLLLQIDFKV